MKRVFTKSLALLCFVFFTNHLISQTTGMILEPASGSSAAILDPNSDGYVSTTTAGFLGNDKINSEIAYKTLIPAVQEPSSDVRNGPNCGFSDFVESVSGGIDPVFHYFPWTIPGLLSVSSDAPGMSVTNASYVILALGFVLGVAATVRQWRRSDYQ